MLGLICYFDVIVECIRDGDGWLIKVGGIIMDVMECCEVE